MRFAYLQNFTVCLLSSGNQIPNVKTLQLAISFKKGILRSHYNTKTALLVG